MDRFRGIDVTHVGHETDTVQDVRRTGGGRGLRGGPGKRVNGVSPGRPQSFWYQLWPVGDNCSPGRQGMAQDGGRRSGPFHGKMDRCRKSQGWTTACSSRPERDGKDQGYDSSKHSSKQTYPCRFTRHSRLATRTRIRILRAFLFSLPMPYCLSLAF